MVESSVRLLGITGPELAEEVIQDGRGGQFDNFCADLSLDGCRTRLHTWEVKLGQSRLMGPSWRVTPRMLRENSWGDMRQMSAGPRNVVRRLPFVIPQVAMILGQFDVILNTQRSDPRWIQGDKTCKVEIQLDLNKPDLHFAAIEDLPLLNWLKGG